MNRTHPVDGAKSADDPTKEPNVRDQEPSKEHPTEEPTVADSADGSAPPSTESVAETEASQGGDITTIANTSAPSAPNGQTRWIVVHRDDERRPLKTDENGNNTRDPSDRGNPYATRIVAATDDEARAIAAKNWPSHEIDEVINEDLPHQQPVDYRNGGTLTTVDADQRSFAASMATPATNPNQGQD